MRVKSLTSHFINIWQKTREGYSSLALVEMCRSEFESRPIQIKSDPFIYTFIYQSAQFWAKFWAKSPNFSKILVGKILKNLPIHTPNFAFYKGSLILISRGWFCYPCWQHIPAKVFCTEYPPCKKFSFKLHIVWYCVKDQLNLKVLTMMLYFKFHFFPHLLIFLQFRDPFYVLNLSTKAVLHKWHIQCKRAKYLQFELIFRRA